MNAPRVVTALSITLLLSYQPTIISSGKTPKNQTLPLQAFIKKTDEPKKVATPAPASVWAPPANLEPVSPAPSPESSKETTPTSTPPSSPTVSQVIAPTPAPAQPVVATKQESAPVVATTQSSEPTSPSLKKEVTTPESTTLSYDISKVKEPRVEELKGLKGFLSWSYITPALNSSAKPTEYTLDDLLSNINRGLNELATLARNLKTGKTKVDNNDLRAIMNSWKTYNANLNDIIKNLKANNIQITNKKLEQAAQTLKFVNQAFLAPYLALVLTEVKGQMTDNINTINTLDELRTDKEQPKWLTQAEVEVLDDMSDFQTNITAYLAADNK